jgi:hypothetical protein
MKQKEQQIQKAQNENSSNIILHAYRAFNNISVNQLPAVA